MTMAGQSCIGQFQYQDSESFSDNLGANTYERITRQTQLNLKVQKRMSENRR